MVNRAALRAILLATSCLMPLGAHAQSAATGTGGATGDNSQIVTHGEGEFDVLGQWGKNADQAGRYDGFTNSGVDFLGQFDVTGRPVQGSNSTWYYNATGTNLMFQTGSRLGSGVGDGGNYTAHTLNNIMPGGELSFDLGQQGTWASSFDYDVISYTGNVIDSFYTVNGGNATINNGLQKWGGSTGGATPLNKAFYTTGVLAGTNALQPVQTGTRRDIFGGDFKYYDGSWTFTGAMRHEHKEGSMEESFDGPWGGTPFALPVDYTTDRYDAKASYATAVNQAVFQYTFSNFQDGNLYVNLPYPFSNTAAPFQESAAYSTPPSNSAHYLTIQLATNAVPKTRLNGNLRLGLEVQDDTFAPDTADPNPPIGNLNTAYQGTSHSSPDDIARVIQGRFSADTHPFERVDANVFYGLDGRLVTLNQNQVYTGGTGGSSDTSFTSSNFVVPQNWFKQNTGAELGYRLIPEDNTRITVGYRYDVVDRSNAQVGRSHTDTETAAISSSIGPQIDGRLSYQHAERSGVVNYFNTWSSLAGSATPSYDYSVAYYQAPMTSDGVKLTLDYTPIMEVTTGMFLQFKNDNYNYPAATALANGTPPLSGTGEGIKQDYNFTVGPDVTYRPTESVNVHAFYTYERIYFNNFGNGACATSNTGTCAGSVGYFQNQYTSAVHTVGLNGDWKVTEKLKLNAEYTVAYGSVMFGEYNGVFVSSPSNSYQNVTSYPDINSLMNNFKVTASYDVMPNVTFLVQGAWTYYRDNNFYDTAGPIQGAGTTAVSYLTPGYDSPNYSIAAIMTGVRVKF